MQVKRASSWKLSLDLIMEIDSIIFYTCYEIKITYNVCIEVWRKNHRISFNHFYALFVLIKPGTLHFISKLFFFGKFIAKRWKIWYENKCTTKEVSFPTWESVVGCVFVWWKLSWNSPNNYVPCAFCELMIYIFSLNFTQQYQKYPTWGRATYKC